VGSGGSGVGVVGSGVVGSGVVGSGVVGSGVVGVGSAGVGSAGVGSVGVGSVGVGSVGVGSVGVGVTGPGGGVVGGGVVGVGVTGPDTGPGVGGVGPIGLAVTDGDRGVATVGRSTLGEMTARSAATSCRTATAGGAGGWKAGRNGVAEVARRSLGTSGDADSNRGASAGLAADQFSMPGATTPMVGIASGPAATNHSSDSWTTDATGRLSLAVCGPLGEATAVWTSATTAATVKAPALLPTTGTAGKERRGLLCLPMETLASSDVRVRIFRGEFRSVQPPNRGGDALCPVRGGRHGTDDRKRRVLVTRSERPEPGGGTSGTGMRRCGSARRIPCPAVVEHARTR
jgi:hypothetical protein